MSEHKSYRVIGFGRTRGSIGIGYRASMEVEAPSSETYESLGGAPEATEQQVESK